MAKITILKFQHLKIETLQIGLSLLGGQTITALYPYLQIDWILHKIIKYLAKQWLKLANGQMNRKS